MLPIPLKLINLNESSCFWVFLTYSTPYLNKCVSVKITWTWIHILSATAGVCLMDLVEPFPVGAIHRSP